MLLKKGRLQPLWCCVSPHTVHLLGAAAEAVPAGTDIGDHPLGLCIVLPRGAIDDSAV
jgi:hypothetical protein